jgi:GTP cyclohydrolase I
MNFSVEGNQGRIMDAVCELLESVGENSKREGLLDTPARVAKAYKKFFEGYGMNPADILSTTFNDDEHQEIVIVKNIQFYSHCEHHMVPFFGKAHVAYIPQGKVVGISKLARLVECYARRLQIQERLTSQIADDMVTYLDPLGVMVILDAEHMCMTSRGIEKPGTSTVTSAVRGVFRDKPEARAEALMLIKG